MKAHTFSTLVLAACFAVTTCVPSEAAAFCGFYVSDTSARLTNDATMVNLLRDGNRTVLTMRNGYEGPPEDFSMVIPVPEVLERDDVETIAPSVFDRLDRLTSPRLVKYWKDPWCLEPMLYSLQEAPKPAELTGVRVMSSFEAGEYEIAILDAEDSNGLIEWLNSHDYSLPDGAESYLRPYIEREQYFFVAKVDADRVSFEATSEGRKRAVLSPLRFHYESSDFRLPVRLGLINADEPQDLVVTILSREGRYEVANRPNVTIPTNLRVSKEVEGRFGQFYNRLFSKTVSEAVLRQCAPKTCLEYPVHGSCSPTWFRGRA